MKLAFLLLVLGMASGKDVLETQHTTCTISTEQLVATARATVTRVIKGLCNLKEMENLFKNMEARLLEEMNLLKSLILNFGDRLFEPHRDRVQLSKRRSVKAEDGTGRLDDWNTLEEELRMYNSTIHTKWQGRVRRTVFTYYWRTRGLAPQRSPSFYVSPSGYRMYLRMQPWSNQNIFYIYVGVTKGDFDNDLSWPFKLQHQVSLLDQLGGRERDDISSALWDPTRLCSIYDWQRPTSDSSDERHECTVIGVFQSALRSGRYVLGGNFLVRLTVYLEKEP